MTRFVIYTVVTSLIAIGCLIESVEPCTDDFVKQMAVSVCGLSKRSFGGADNGWSIFGGPFGRIFGLNFGRISDVDREYRRLVGDADETEFLLRGVSGIKKPKESNVVRQRPKHLTIYGGDGETSIRTYFFPKPEMKDHDDHPSAVSKRDIMTLVRECCYRKCTADDFKGICDKK